MQHMKEYPNGLRLICKTLPGVLSVGVGVFAGVGSADETPGQSGISHYLEHMMFKGTETRSAFDIADAFERIGAQVNAYTSKEITCYYCKSTAEHAGHAAGLLSDIFFNSVFSEEESAREKKVILEEIAMVEDSPGELCLDVAAEAYYGKHPLGAAILGSAERVKGFTKADIDDHICSFYTPANVCVVFAGAVQFEEAAALAEQYFVPHFKCASRGFSRCEKEQPQKRLLMRDKDIEQAHLCFAFPAPASDSLESHAFALLTGILGGGMSSRLFQKVREELGLAYTVYAYPSAYRNSGVLSVYAAVNPKSARKAADAVLKEIKLFQKNGFTAEEFARAKEQVKSALVFGQESSTSIMSSFGKYLLITGKVLDLESKITDINALTPEYAREVLSGMFDPARMCMAAVGKEKTVGKAFGHLFQ